MMKRTNNYSRRLVFTLSGLLTLFMLIAANCFAQFAGGQGTEASPWQIETANHLNSVREYLGAEHNDKHFVQTANINLGEAPWNEGAGWVPIGTFANRFNGTYDGDGHTISGLTMNPEDLQQYSGLFGCVEAGTIKNLGVIDVDISNVGYRSGPIVGALLNAARVVNCYATGELSAGRGNQISGLVGVTTSAQIIDCWSDVEFTTEGSWCGGIVGTHGAGSIVSNSYSMGNVTSTLETAQNIGGLLGMNSSGTVVNSYSTGNVTTPAGVQRVGALIGRNMNGTVTNCYATGRVSNHNGANQEGGLIGGVVEGVVENSYWNIESTGIPTSSGGQSKTTEQMLQQATFEEWDFDEVWSIGFENRNTYPWLQLQENAGSHNYPVPQAPSNLTAFIDNQSRVNLSWSPPSFGEPDEYNVYRNDEFLTRIEFGTNNFRDGNVENLTRYIYNLTAVYGDDESPFSAPAFATPVPGGFAGGTGFTDDPYQITTSDQLNYVRHNPYANYIQTEDIDLSNFDNWLPIGLSGDHFPFTGSYNGNGYEITGMTINRVAEDYIGLFSQVGLGAGGAVIRKVVLQDIDVVGRNFVGGLIGRSNANTVIDSCRVTGDVESVSNSPSVYAGGLIGYAMSTEVANSSTGGSVEAENNFVGGLIGSNIEGLVENCYSTSNIGGGRYVGGFVGYHRGSITNSYALGSVHGTNVDIGGFAGNTVVGDIQYSYAGGRVTSVQGAADVGGFIGRHSSGNIVGCYWDIESTEQEASAGGEGRLSRQMTYPHDQETFINWNFADIWRNDTTGNMNDGYPYLFWQPIVTSPHPDIAVNPEPQHQAANISVSLENVRWSYTVSEHYTDPAGFRVYFNTTGQFGEDDDFVWIAYTEEQANYATGEILPDELAFNTTYYWKVVPTTVDPNDNRNSRSRRGYSYLRSEAMIRNDAENVPVWQFTTEIYPDPVVATNPQPEHEAEDVPVALENVGWTYTIDPDHRNPLGFRVYMNTSGEFDEDDEFVWVPFSVQQSNYTTSNILPEQLEYAQTYFWKVVPTTNEPEGRSGDSRERRARSKGQRALSRERGDAENVPVWSFSTITSETYPLPATNPDPEHLATGINLGLTSVSWDYISSDIFADPVGFRVYLNTTGAFGQNAPYVWVDYVEDQQTYISSEIVPDFLDSNTTYYWRVIPTTNHPDDRTGGKLRRKNDKTSQRHNPFLRGDAQNVAIWRFTTGTTDADDETIIPLVTELNSNYPNPFNPETTINFSLAEAGEVSIDVFNSRGQKVATIVDCYLEAGKHQVQWNSRDSNNQEVSSGIYFYRMRNGSFTFTNKMIMMK